MKGDMVFELSRVSYTYMNDGDALESISMRIRKGENVSILGANGSGKSTLLKLLDGLYFPSSGEFRAFGSSIHESSMNDKKISMEFHKRVGFIFQDPDAQLFLPTVWDEVTFAPLQLGLSKNRVKEIASEVLNKMGLYGLKDRTPYHLSEGEKKKVCIASIFTLDPEVWLMDEPTASLDPQTQGWMIDFILELAKRGKTCIIATHDLEIPYVTSQTCYILGEDHKILAEGKAKELLSQKDILLKANLIHKHRHFHNGSVHIHPHEHWHV